MSLTAEERAEIDTWLEDSGMVTQTPLPHLVRSLRDEFDAKTTEMETLQVLAKTVLTDPGVERIRAMERVVEAGKNYRDHPGRKDTFARFVDALAAYERMVKP